MSVRAGDDEIRTSAVDIVFALASDAGASLPSAHRSALADEVERALPWLGTLPGAGVHRLNLAGGVSALLSHRTRLVLRLPRARAEAAARLEGAELQLGATRLRVGASQVRELLPWGTLYAHVVAAAAADELAFLRATEGELAAMGVSCRAICGRLQVLESGALQGYSLLLDGLTVAGSLRVLQAGVGAHRRLGCGLFVPHRHAAAVGTPH